MTLVEVEERELKSYEQEIKREGLDLIENRESLIDSPLQKAANAKYLVSQYQETMDKELLKRAIRILEELV